MTFQMPLFEKTESQPSKVAVRAEEIVDEGFDVKKFVENFKELAEAGGAIERLRGLILDLAIHGVLTSGTRRVRVEESRPNPFDLPSGWAWLNLGTLAEFINGDRSKNYPSKQHQVTSGIPFINAGHLRGRRVDLTEMNFITEERFQLLRSGKVRKNDILYCLRGSLGKAAIVRGLSEAQ
jgi:type I restriction enzyme, S subunit